MNFHSRMDEDGAPSIHHIWSLVTRRRALPLSAAGAAVEVVVGGIIIMGTYIKQSDQDLFVNPSRRASELSQWAASSHKGIINFKFVPSLSSCWLLSDMDKESFLPSNT